MVSRGGFFIVGRQWCPVRWITLHLDSDILPLLMCNPQLSMGKSYALYREAWREGKRLRFF